MEIPFLLEEHADLANELTDAIFIEMDYGEAYERFVKGNPTKKLFEALYSAPPPSLHPPKRRGGETDVVA